jgi:hypothetical protein
VLGGDQRSLICYVENLFGGWGCSSVVECLPSIHESLSSSPITMRGKNQNNLDVLSGS